MDRYDYETLKDCLPHTYNKFDPLSLKVWYVPMDNILSVGRILADEYVITTAKDMLDYVDKPWHWENDMRDLIVDYELERMSEDLERLSYSDTELALEWLSEFGFDSKTIGTLETDLEERELCRCEGCVS